MGGRPTCVFMVSTSDSGVSSRNIIKSDCYSRRTEKLVAGTARNPLIPSRPVPTPRVALRGSSYKTRSCAHTVGGRGLGTPLCPVPAVAAEAEMMARLTTTWTKPDETGLCVLRLTATSFLRPWCR